MFYELVHNGTTTFHVLIVHRAGAVNRHQNARTEFVLLTRNIKSLSTIWSHTGIFSVLIHCVRLESLQDCLRVKFRSIGSKNCLEQTTTNVTPLRSIFCNVVSDFLDFLVYQSIFFPTFRSLFSCVLGAIKILIQCVLRWVSTSALTLLVSLALTLALTLSALSATTLLFSAIHQHREHFFKEPVVFFVELDFSCFLTEFCLVRKFLEHLHNFLLVSIQHRTLIFVKRDIVRCLLENLEWVAFTSSDVVQSNSQTFTKHNVSQNGTFLNLVQPNRVIFHIDGTTRATAIQAESDLRVLDRL